MNNQSESPETQSDSSTDRLVQLMMQQMENLADPSKNIEQEIKKSQAMTSVATVVINTAKVRIDAARVNHLISNKPTKGKLTALPAGKDKQISNG